MAQDSNFARGYEIVSRWRVLAERRLEHLNELYESGRWRRYHTEQAFVDNIRDAKRAVEAWRKLDPSLSKAVDASTASGADVSSELQGTVSERAYQAVSAELLPQLGLTGRVGADHDLREA